MNYAQELENAINFLKRSVSDYGFHGGVVSDREKEISDLQHELELSAKDAKSRTRVSRELQKTLISRRYHKDIEECTGPIDAFMRSHPKLLNELSALLGQVRKVDEYHQNRHYTPRVRDDLTIPRMREKH